MGENVEHEVRPCTENPIEQSHSPVKKRYHPTLGLKQFISFAKRWMKCVTF
ncbi:hypothetical protein AM1_5429 [Acaryochloris marina MBIC11017]|uniref:DDE domain-containing protein n=1 Tax=Acaryochloris marina (strain MBIC 11017) TaxID=329726 RepID=B0CCU3_ACAM1|nr:hypothetical protein AM1_5429 [Acaryochloris marina MBIC11017]